jgi:hypothetical protein
MASLLRPFTVIAQAVKAFFRADVRLRRGERGLEVVLDEPAPRPARGRQAAPRADAAAQREQQELQRIRQSLTRLLDELPENRSTLRHLAFVEHALAKKGLRGLSKVPYDVLKRALDQFESVVINWSDEGLATLRSKMAVMLIERESDAPAAGEPRDVESTVSGLGAADAEALTHPVVLEGSDADEAEAALLAAYGNVMLPGLNLDAGGDGAAASSAVEWQGELHSPSAKAMARAVRRGGEVQPQARSHELHA